MRNTTQAKHPIPLDFNEEEWATIVETADACGQTPQEFVQKMGEMITALIALEPQENKGERK